jgi:hypothetical protein
MHASDQIHVLTALQTILDRQLYGPKNESERDSVNKSLWRWQELNNGHPAYS